MKNKELDRLMGSVVGFLIGDALGAPVEFAKIPKPVTDFEPAYRKGLKAGQYTDDTQHLIISLDSLIENQGAIDLDNIGKRLIQWYSANPRSIGRTTEQAIQNLKKRVPPEKSGIDHQNACGSLALARLIPYCLYSALVPYEVKLTSGNEKRILGVTHAHKDVARMGSLVNYYIQEMAQGKSSEAVTFQIVDEDNFLNKKYRKKLEQVLDLSQNRSIDPTSAIETIGDSGFVEDIVYSAIYSVLRANNFRNSVLFAANGFGDADSRAAITGSLAGLQYGYSQIPEQWKSQLEDHELLKEKAKKLFDVVNSTRSRFSYSQKIINQIINDN
jgi:ADP-ribosylglycohydrolase